MKKKQKIQRLLKSLSPDVTKVDFSAFDQSVATLKSSLEQKIQINTVDDVKSQLEKFKARLNLQPILDSVDTIKTSFDAEIQKIADALDAKTEELNSADQTKADRMDITALEGEIATLQAQLDDLDSTRKGDIIKLRKSIPDLTDLEGRIGEYNTQLSSRLDVLEKPQDIIDWQGKIDTLQGDVMKRISTIGGGSMNRQMLVEGVDVLTKYTDVNLYGTTSSIITSVDNINKRINIGFPAGTGGAGNPASPDTGVQYNDGGSFGATSIFTYNKAITALNIASVVTITNNGTGNALKINQVGNTSASISIGGALNVTNTNNTGAGLVVYSNHGAGQVGRQFVVYSQSSLLTVDTALIQSDATNNTALNIKGVPTGKGVLKVEHLGNTAGDSNGSGISIDLQGSGTAAQGIFLDATNGGTTGNLLEIRNAGATKLRLSSGGAVTFNSAYTFPTADGTANFALTTNGAGQLSFSSVAGTGGSGITRQSSIVSISSIFGAVANTDYVAFANVGIKLTLPTAIGNTNFYTIKNTSASSVLVTTTSAQTIDGSASALIPDINTSLDFLSDNSNWNVV